MGDLSIDQKMAFMQAEMTRVPKNGFNNFHKYAYATESDVVDHVRVTCERYKCYVTVSYVRSSLKIERMPHKDGTKMGCSFEMRATVVCSETHESISVDMPTYSEATDDKAVFKAITGGKKYAHMLLFNIATGEDPERDNKPEKVARQVATAPKPTPAPVAVTFEHKQRVLAMTLFSKLGYTDEQRYDLYESVGGYNEAGEPCRSWADSVKRGKASMVIDALLLEKDMKGIPE